MLWHRTLKSQMGSGVILILWVMGADRNAGARNNDFYQALNMAKEEVCVGAEEEFCVGAAEEGVSCTLRIILPIIPEHHSSAGAILQAGFLAIISVFCIGNNLAFIKVRNIRKTQELMVLHFLTRYWSHWCTTKISLPLINWMEVT
ncbi:Os04g0302400 [Oryza sativa Japonica Group]|uniref:cDNA clone:J023022E21, full insert sequence n=3 Tax=Oryza TaxID=4527 RepID=Q0JEB4_ORYSJ|nr:Os04g0302400 [Oryza sativa Japonica Group]BAG91449.1 unnamed protein product [Oryza sativa Japonica Group]|eukprot:NP_001052409.1 Os04g0302400 [Oryza sativa Japonica Group]